MKMDHGVFGQRVGASYSFMITARLTGTCMRSASLNARPLSSRDGFSVQKTVFVPFVFALSILSFELLRADTANAVWTWLGNIL
jgi:hypothetical protein